MSTTPALTTVTETEIADLAEAVAHEGRRRALALATGVRPSPRTEMAIEVIDRTAAPCSAAGPSAWPARP